MKDFTLSSGELQTYGEMATAIRQVIATQGLEQEQDYKRKYPNCPISQKRLDTLVQKRNPGERAKSDGPYKCLGTDDFGVRGVRKRLNLCDLSPSCLEEISHSVLVK